MKTWPIACLCLLLPGALFAAPTAQQIETAHRALVDCRLADPAALLDRHWLDDLVEFQRLALHENDVRENLWEGDQAVIAQLRRKQHFDLSDVYAAECRGNKSAAMRQALGQMRTADPIVVRNVSFVPLVTPAGEYLGMGLSFMLREGSWRLEALDNTVLARDANSIGISMQLGSRLGIEDIEGYAASCLADLPPAPMPRLETDLVDADVATDDATDEYADNALGAAQRLAALRFAEGRGERPSIVAKVILAEILLRSLDFANAPPALSEGWRQRVERAERLLADARLHSIDWLRMAPTLIWLARAHETGAGGLSIDPLLARTYLTLAASTNDPNVTEFIADRLKEVWQPVPPSTDLRFEMPVEVRGCD
ncbi:MAG TPA: hypothetical protein VN259_14645 [Xanthomonadales bacterium]|nr:hypothetical protein [Xanthomonadales bacterium]